MSSQGLEKITKIIADQKNETPLLISTPYQEPLAQLTAWLKETFPPEVLLEPEAAGSITIKHIRQTIRQISHTNLTGQGKFIVLLAQAERLSLPAANALLKSLEESAAKLQFVLTTRWPGRLPATIRSRTEHIRLAVTKVPELSPRDSLWPTSLLLRLNNWSEKGGLSEEHLQIISQALATELREVGPSRQLNIAYQRLRDYYKLTQVPGDKRTIGDVLLASLPTLMAR